MFSFIWHTIFFDPIYNTLVFFIDVFPNGDVGLAIVAAVILVKLVLFPFSIKAVKTQKVMQEIQPKLNEIKEKYKDDREKQAKEMMQIYADAGMNPFASIVLVFLQIPIFIALYFAVANGGGVPLPDINVDLLYPFVGNPESVSMLFFGHFDITGKSLFLAVGAGLAQFVHMQLSMPKIAPKPEGEELDFKADFMRNMQLQMKYMMPIMIVFIGYTAGAVFALYFFVSNLSALAQEYFVRKHRS